jgi:ABC-type transporter Mla subunit MlaD
MDDLTTIRRSLEQLLSVTAERHHQIDARERLLAERGHQLDQRQQELAAAIELTRDSAIWRQCVAEQRQWFRQLIASQLAHLRPCSSTAMVLRRLSELVGGADD